MQGWFDSHTWLHYDQSKDLLLSVCMKAVKKRTLITSRCAEKLLHLSVTGFSNWKDAKVSSLRECSCLPIPVENSPVVVSVIDRHLAVIAGHDPFMLYVYNLLCAW